MFLLPIANGNSFSRGQDSTTERESPFIRHLLSPLPRN